jgi:hypothetical protein
MLQRPVLQLDVCPQPSLNIQDYPWAVGKAPHRAEDKSMIQRIEKLTDIQILMSPVFYPSITEFLYSSSKIVLAASGYAG